MDMSSDGVNSLPNCWTFLLTHYVFNCPFFIVIVAPVMWFCLKESVVPVSCVCVVLWPRILPALCPSLPLRGWEWLNACRAGILLMSWTACPCRIVHQNLHRCSSLFVLSCLSWKHTSRISGQNDNRSERHYCSSVSFGRHPVTFEVSKDDWVEGCRDLLPVKYDK